MAEEAIGLVLDGGGFPGVKQVGLVEELWKRGKIPSLIQGISVGALNAAKLVEAGPDPLREYWLMVEHEGPQSVFSFKLRSIAMNLRSVALLTSASLDRMVSTLDMKKIVESPIELQVVVRNETDQCPDVVSSRNPLIKENPELLRQFIKASAALPGIFPPVVINGKRYSDGYCPQLSEFKDFHLIIFALNDDPGLVDMAANGKWWARGMLGPREVTDYLTGMMIENFLLKNPKFCNLVIDSRLTFLQRFGEKFKQVAKEVIGILTAKEKEDEPKKPQHRLVVVSPTFEIPTLRLHKFNKGDITLAIQEGRKQAVKLCDQLFPVANPS